MTVIKTALISVSDKTGLIEFARGLKALGVTILSTGGTAGALREHGIAVTEVSEHTGFPEMLDGRVKTLHPTIHGGILARRDVPAHARAIEAAGIAPIDLVAVNLYPFIQTVARPDCTAAEAIENIDIGGPAMVRSAAKNHAHVAVITDTGDYPSVLEEMRANEGAVSASLRFRLARKAFSHTAAYDGAISNYLSALDDAGSSVLFPRRLNLHFDLAQTMRYGENPHQQAAFYRDLEPAPGTLAHYAQLQGKELSYNNIADADAAWECVKSFAAPACVIIKHANPCGAAIAANALEAYRLAFATDPTSAFGGIIAFNRQLDGATAAAVAEQFVEVVVVPGISAEARAVLAGKDNVRVLEVPWEGSGKAPYAETLPHSASAFPPSLRSPRGEGEARRSLLPPGEGLGREETPAPLPGGEEKLVTSDLWTRMEYKRVGGGMLVQTRDDFVLGQADFRVVTKAQPTPQQEADLAFAWRVAKFVKSNAIVFAGGGRTLGVGAGQMSRVDSARIAAIKARSANLALAGSVVASDAFFPFRDGLDVVVDAGAIAVIQPGGSLRDAEVIAAADERGIAMVFTGHRHFRH